MELQRWKSAFGQDGHERHTGGEDDDAVGLDGWKRGGVCEISTSKGQNWRADTLPWGRNYRAKCVGRLIHDHMTPGACLINLTSLVSGHEHGLTWPGIRERGGTDTSGGGSGCRLHSICRNLSGKQRDDFEKVLEISSKWNMFVTTDCMQRRRSMGIFLSSSHFDLALI